MAVPPEIMQQSPHDAPSCKSTPATLVQIAPRRDGPREWVPSRFNARAMTEDGRMVLWNTMSGKITAFEPPQVPLVEEMLSQKGFVAPDAGITEYLQKRGYIVERGTSEKQRLQYHFGKQHYRTDVLSLILMTSEDCNFRCVYCYEDFERGTMTVATREGIKEYVRKRAPRLRELSISYFGGEPLYGWSAVKDMAPFFQEIVQEYKLDCANHMTTNGYLLTPETADHLLSWNVRDFQITLDGPAEYHDRKRVGRDGSGTWHTIIQNLRAMRARDDEFRITIRVNYDRDNAPILPDFVQLIGAEFGTDPRFHIAFHAVGKWGGDNDANLDTCGLTEEKNVSKEMNRRAIDTGFEVRGLQAMNRLGNGVCYAARPYNFLIGADGKVMKCTVALDKEDYNVVGRITPEGEMVLDPDKMALWTEPAFENDAGCQKCYMVPVCQGASCPLIRIQTGERPCPPIKRTLQSALVDTYEMGRRRVAPTQVTREGVSAPALLATNGG